ncbi:glycosyltransferase [Bradyrhizobium sp. URHD0069]|uniref:glycosyltransferase n=1 Tax=Bradyrhizobium sp. URHD0069 TaxID=1380355 RepID=UPI00068AAFD6|nr:glycosyltransferase [Bradyrhizobium sp. URHD0069]
MNTPDQIAGRRSGAAKGRHRVMSLGTFAAIVSFIACIHLAFWALKKPDTAADSVEDKLPSVSYNRFAQKTPAGPIVPEAQIRTDLAAIAAYAESVRTYASTQGLERVPEIARELGLTVTLGIWLDKDEARNEREIATALDLARRYRNVTRLVVGNETFLRHEHSAAELAKIVRRVKRDSPVPVATADHWKTFIDHPELVDAVDEVFAHILPYWEGMPKQTALDGSLALYELLRAKYPSKKIVIGEFGWPSAGHNFERAVPDPVSQAVLLRNFVARANVLGIDYNIVEAIDQPEKLFEGNVGPYWGIFDASLQPKFAWTGQLVDADYWKAALLAVSIGLLLSISILALRGATAGQATLLAAADHLVGHWCASVLVYWQGHYFLHGEVITFAIALPLLGLLAPIARSRLNEMATVALGHEPARLLNVSSSAPAVLTPKVSIHIPAYREPPEMLLRTIDSVAQLDYPDFECVVVINNTPDPAFWRPIEARCRDLGPRFKFVRVENLRGFKAAALRLAMAETSADAQIIGIIDADYVVDPKWLKDLIPGFADSKVGLIQAPQDHRDGDRSAIHAAMNAEYAGFFDIGMVERNEVNAIIVHGTMCLIRRTALEAAGGWSSDTICEDSDLGLTILERGWRAHYTNQRYGWGLLPQDYMAFRTQRSRWAGGAVQIVKKHWRQFLPGTSLLDRDQKREFAFGWLSWFGAEIIAVAAALLNLVWVPFVAFKIVAIPDPLLTLPIISAFIVSLAHFVCAYRLRVAVPYRQMFGAMVVFMSVQWTVASAAFKAALPAHGNYFHRTPKGKGVVVGTRILTMPETVLGALLVAGAITIFATNFYRVLEADLFATILLIQSLPFLSAVALVWLERLGEGRSQKLAAVRPAGQNKMIS